MVKGKSNYGRKRKHKLTQNLSKKEKKHLEQFGEIHPADDRSASQVKYKKVEDVSASPPKQDADQISSSSDEEAEEASVYQQLISTISSASSEAAAIESESDDEEEGDAEETTEKASSDDSSSSDDDEDSDDEPEADDISDDEEDQAITKESDPFSIHVEQDLEDDVAEKLLKSPSVLKETFKVPVIGNTNHVKYDQVDQSHIIAPNFKEKDMRKLGVKQKLCEQVALTNKKYTKTELSGKDVLNPFQHSIFTLANSYRDLYYPEESHENREQIRLVYCLHALNHVLKTRSRVIAHNEKIKAKGDDNLTEEYRDQGLTRPKVLIVVPFRDSALRIVKMLASLLMNEEKSYVSNKKRFYTEYGEDKEEKQGKKPEDYEKLFSGNIDDHFRVGLGIAKKSLKIYTDFYSSDIIVASPLGLRTVIGAQGEEERDFDFLSSIEVLIFDQAEVFLMQNWDHILHLLAHMHQQPKESHGQDFSRVRMWTLNGWSKLYRQTMIFSSLVSPELNALINKHCHNYCGKVLVPKNHISGAICQVAVQLPQVFQRFDASSFAQCAEARFQYFKDKILSEYTDSMMAQTMIFIPSYFDYVRLRNYFKNEGLSFVQLSEYSKTPHISRSRNRFYHRKAHFLFYTERLHFYRRFTIRGAKHLIFYELPLYSAFYSELCNMLQDKRETTGRSCTCTVLYSKYDAQRLAAVVGMERAAHMVGTEQNVHMLVSGEES